MTEHTNPTLTAGFSDRRVGVELAFSALEPGDAARRISEMYGGQVGEVEPGRWTVNETELGIFDVRCTPVQPRASGNGAKTHSLTRAAVANLPTASDQDSACEIRCPPVHAHQLSDIDQIYDELKRSGQSAEATTLAIPFGFDLAVEAPDLDARSIGRVLKAYCLMCDWLRQDYETADIQEAMVFPRPYALTYRTLVLDPSPISKISRRTTFGPTPTAIGSSICCRCSPISCRIFLRPPQACRRWRRGPPISSNFPARLWRRAAGS